MSCVLLRRLNNSVISVRKALFSEPRGTFNLQLTFLLQFAIYLFARIVGKFRGTETRRA